MTEGLVKRSALLPCQLTTLFVLAWFVCWFPNTAEAWRWKHWRLKLDLRYAAGWDDNVSRLALPAEPDTVVPWTQIPPPGENKPNPLTSQLPPAAIQQDAVHQMSGRFRARFRNKYHIWSARYALGGKLFHLTPGENVVIQSGQTSYHARPHRRILLGASFRIQDRRRINTSREFTLLSGQAQFFWFAPAGFRLLLNAGYNYFNYRNFELFEPDSYLEDFTDGQRFSFHGDFYDITLTKQFGQVFRLSLSYELSRRAYNVRRSRLTRTTNTGNGALNPLTSNCSNDPSAPDRMMICSLATPRNDLSHRFSLGFRMLYKVLLQGSYHFRIQNADSYGESFTGHNIRLTFAATPFWQIYLVLQMQLQFRNYFNGTPFDTSRGQTSENDNLTSLTIRLSRPIWKNLNANLRYSHTANLFGLGINQYSRNLLTAGFSLAF